jgi:hypothetical protein
VNIAMMPRIVRSLGWPLSRWRLLAHAFVLHTSIAILLRIVPFGRLLQWGRRVYRTRSAARTPQPDEQLIAWAVRRAAAISRLEGTCLSEALAAHWLLRASARSSSIRFGVGAAPGAPFAHAWLECGGRTLVGMHAGSYQPLSNAGLTDSSTP